MKRLYALLFLLACVKSGEAQYSSQNINLISTWSEPGMPAENFYGIKYNSVWGYYDSIKKREYAILGSGKGTHILEVTNPANPVLRDFVPGSRDSCIWREYKTYKNYLYAVSDDSGPTTLQIMDLSYLPDSVKVVHDADTIISRSHTLYIDGDKLYFGLTRGSFGVASMAVYSLADPEKPVPLRKLGDDYPLIGQVHDMLVRNDTVYASCGNQGLHIYKLTSSNTFNELAYLTSYPQQGYNHSSALSPDGKYLFFTDEAPHNLAVKSLDVSDLMNITVLDTFRSSFTATPHNLYTVGKDRLMVAYYQDGLQIFDVSDPADPFVAGYFDTNPTDGAGTPVPAYSGCWGAYTGLPSGITLASDMQNGLFVLDASVALGIKPLLPEKNSISVYPNPMGKNVSLYISLIKQEELSYEIFDLRGRLIISKTQTFYPGNSTVNITTEKMSAGYYLLTVKGREINYSAKIVKGE